MAKRKTTELSDSGASRRAGTGRPSALIDTRVIYCGDGLDQLRKLPDGCVDRVSVWHRLPAGELHGTRNYEVFWGRTSGLRAQARERAMRTVASPRAPDLDRGVAAGMTNVE